MRLGSRALEILAVLLNHAGQVVHKDQIIRQVWPDTVVEENNLRVHLVALRKMLGEESEGAPYIQNIPGRGYSFIGALTVHGTLPPVTIPPNTLLVNSLPASSIGEIIGRDAYIAAVVEQLARVRMVTITGSGGVGKTTVAIAAAGQLANDYNSGVAFVDLALISSATMVNSALASVLGCSSDSQRTVQDLVDFIGSRRMLIVLDNCEHVLAGCAELATALLRGCRGLAILATSRERLLISGEWVHQLPPLALPPLSAASCLQDAIHFPAVRLFIERACASSSSFKPTDLDARIIVDICNRLDGVALAIELAASRVNAISLKSLAQSLNGSLSALGRGSRTAVPRHQALIALIDWSFNLLPAAEKLLFQRVGVFNGHFSLEAAQSICSSAELPGDKIEAGLVGLIEKSLIIADISSESVKYRLLETNRAHSQDKLKSSGEHAERSHRHAKYYQCLFERAEVEWRNRPTKEWLEAYADQIGNLRASLAWTTSPSGERSVGIALTVAAIPLWFQLSLIDECLEHVAKALRSLGQSTSEKRVRMKLYAALGWPHMSGSEELVSGASAWRKTLEIAKGLDDADFQLRSLWALWVDKINHGEPREAHVFAMEFCALTPRAEDPSDEWIGERMLGATSHFIGGQTAARHHLDRMLRMYAPPLNRSHAVRFQFDQRATGQVVLARVLWLQGKSDDALAQVRSTLAYAASIEHKLSLANVLAEAACPIALLAGEVELADHYVAMLEEQTRAQSLDVWSTYAECFRGEALLIRGRHPEGFAALSAGLNRLRHRGFLLFASSFLAALGRGYIKTHQAEQGLLCVSAALKSNERTGEGWCTPELLRIQGDLLLIDDPSDANGAGETVFLQARHLAGQQGAVAWEIRTAISCARLYARQGRRPEARSTLDGVMAQLKGQGPTSTYAEASVVFDGL